MSRYRYTQLAITQCREGYGRLTLDRGARTLHVVRGTNLMMLEFEELDTHR